MACPLLVRGNLPRKLQDIGFYGVIKGAMLGEESVGGARRPSTDAITAARLATKLFVHYNAIESINYILI
jgi:hypothetical protein